MAAPGAPTTVASSAVASTSPGLPLLPHPRGRRQRRQPHRAVNAGVSNGGVGRVSGSRERKEQGAGVCRERVCAKREKAQKARSTRLGRNQNHYEYDVSTRKRFNVVTRV